jgi:hypothetical protein
MAVDFADGLVLIELVEELSGTTCTERYNKHPTHDMQKIENVVMALKYANHFVEVTSLDPKSTCVCVCVCVCAYAALSVSVSVSVSVSRCMCLGILSLSFLFSSSLSLSSLHFLSLFLAPPPPKLIPSRPLQKYTKEISRPFSLSCGD